MLIGFPVAEQLRSPGVGMQDQKQELFEARVAVSEGSSGF
jgi:hypothetical protein